MAAEKLWINIYGWPDWDLKSLFSPLVLVPFRQVSGLLPGVLCNAIHNAPSLHVSSSLSCALLTQLDNTDAGQMNSGAPQQGKLFTARLWGCTNKQRLQGRKGILSFIYVNIDQQNHTTSLLPPLPHPNIMFIFPFICISNYVHIREIMSQRSFIRIIRDLHNVYYEYICKIFTVDISLVFYLFMATTAWIMLVNWLLKDDGIGHGTTDRK